MSSGNYSSNPPLNHLDLNPRRTPLPRAGDQISFPSPPPPQQQQQQSRVGGFARQESQQWTAYGNPVAVPYPAARPQAHPNQSFRSAIDIGRHSAGNSAVAAASLVAPGIVSVTEVGLVEASAAARTAQGYHGASAAGTGGFDQRYGGGGDRHVLAVSSCHLQSLQTEELSHSQESDPQAQYYAQDQAVPVSRAAGYLPTYAAPSQSGSSYYELAPPSQTLRPVSGQQSAERQRAQQPQRATPSEQTYRQTAWQQANSGSQFSPAPATAPSNFAHYYCTAPSSNTSYATSGDPDSGILQQQQQQQQQHHGWSLPRMPQSNSSATRTPSPRLQALQSPHQQPAGARQAPRNQQQHSRVQHANSLASPQEQERGQLSLQHFAQHLQQLEQSRQRNEVLSQEERRREEQGREERERKEEERREEEREEEGRRAELRKEQRKEQQRREGQWREERRQDALERGAMQQQRQAEEARGSAKQWNRIPPSRAPGKANPDPRLYLPESVARNAADSAQSSRPQARYQDTPSARNQTHWAQHQFQGQPPQSQQLPDSITNHHAPDIPSLQHQLDMAGPPLQYPHQPQAQQQPTQRLPQAQSPAVVRQPTNQQSVQRQDPTSVVRPADSMPLISSVPVQIQPLSQPQPSPIRNSDNGRPTGQVVPSPSGLSCFSRLTNLQAEHEQPQFHSVTTTVVPPPWPDARRSTELEKALVAAASSEFLTRLGMPIASEYIYGFLQHTHNFVILCEHFESLGHKFQRSDLARALQNALGRWHAPPRPGADPGGGGGILGEVEGDKTQTTNGSGCDAMVPQQPATVPNNSPQHMPLQIAPAQPSVPVDPAESHRGGPGGGEEPHASAPAPQGMAGIASEHQPGFPPPPSQQTPPTSSPQQYLTVNPMQIHKRPPLETFQDPPLAQPLPESDSPVPGASTLPSLAATPPPASIDGATSNLGSATPPAQDVQHGPSESTTTAATPALGGERPTAPPKGIVLIDLTTSNDDTPPPPPPPSSAVVTQEPQKPKGRLAEKIERRKAARVSKYDPREIARAILIVSQRHPTERPLNGHFLPLRENLPGQVNWHSDLSTIRWDILDPDPVDMDVGMDGDDEGELQANLPAALAPANRSRPRKSRPSAAAAAAAGDPRRRQATPGSAETRPEDRAAHASRQRRLQHNTPGAAVENFSRSQTPQSASAMEDGPNSKRRRTGQSTGQSHQRRTDAGSPAFKRYRCKWKGCSSELHNVDNLKRHVSKLHSKRDASSGCYSCQWAGCFRQPTSEQTAGDEGNKLQLLVWEFANEEDWEQHVGHHISAVRQAFGVGPAALMSGRRTPHHHHRLANLRAYD